MTHNTVDPREYKPGDMLPNGYTVIAIDYAACVVLAVLGIGTGRPYVTWRWTREQGLRSTYSGHYWREIGDAARDYDTRRADADAAMQYSNMHSREY